MEIDELVSAVGSVANADALAEVLDPAVLVPVEKQVCGAGRTNLPAMSMRLAAYLLTHPTAPARYACVIDSGLEATLAGGYDSHG